VTADGEVPPEWVTGAIVEQERMGLKLEVANRYNVRRLSDFDHMEAAEYPDVQEVKDIKWSPFRFGVEISNVFAEASAPTADGEPVCVSSDKVFFAGEQLLLSRGA